MTSPVPPAAHFPVATRSFYGATHVTTAFETDREITRSDWLFPHFLRLESWAYIYPRAARTPGVLLFRDTQYDNKVHPLATATYVHTATLALTPYTKALATRHNDFVRRLHRPRSQGARGQL
jgi:hypothetical protein